ncbi:MAG TPA: hypothetical protein ENK91_13450, partial [Bacteroidetes bacterium]|nr:hypothetical protein [Bacteroidota bacterium]
MKKLLTKNKFWAFFIALAFASSLFLFHEYKTNTEITSTTDSAKNIIEKEANIDEDEFESTDF